MEPFDVAVIGSGPAGEDAALTAAKSHRRVAIVERYFEIGGGCTHWGRIPSKALRHAVKVVEAQVAPAGGAFMNAIACRCFLWTSVTIAFATAIPFCFTASIHSP